MKLPAPVRRAVALPLALGATALVAWAAEAVGPGRERVLKQARVPLHYYYREMYLPQATSGVGSPAWSPDGRELAVSLEGALHRVDPATGVARQLTDGPGYDYQPDWSPDGRFLAYSSYRDDALELWALELASGKRWPLTTNGAVNLDPRWSPDGRRIAFVSTAFERRLHVFLLDVSDGVPGASVRLTEERDSGLPRYYYSRFDQYLSPTWSPDGSELIVVSNSGRISGSGSLWRMRAEPGAPLRQVHDEETTWKVRPDWARDGRRVVYASYLGRQWHQLWLVPAEGGDAFPLTYGEFDATAPRWSPDATSIAYVSNQEGTPALWTIRVPGGERRKVEIRERRRLAATGRLQVDVTEDGRYVPARISITTPDGRSFVPEGAWRHADDSFDRAERRIELGYFHSAGSAVVEVPAGPVTLEVTRGLEYQPVRRALDVVAGQTRTEAIALERIADWPARGWWSGDLHVHMNYGGAYRATPLTLRAMAEAEDLHVVFNLIVNKEQRIPDVAWFTGVPDAVSTSRTLLRHDQEFHTSWWGHQSLLGLRSHLLLPDYAGYAGTAAWSLEPTNARVADLARAQGALVGYVHPFDNVPDPSRAGDPAAYPLPGFDSGDPIGLPVDAALGKLDFYEAVGLSDHRATNAVWYRLLNCGFRIPAGAGTDAMTNYASLRGPVGLNRVFVKTDGPLDFDRFLAGLKAGRSMATNGPLVQLGLRPRGSSGPWSEPGDALELPAGRHALEAQVSLRSVVPIDRLEIVRNGEVVATLPLAGDRTSADATVSLPAFGSGWYVARAHCDRSRHPVLDFYPFGTTSPVYVSAGGAPLRSTRDVVYFAAWIDRVRAAAEAHQGWNTAAEKQGVLALLAQARAVYQERALETPRPAQ
ncbi:MAG TPA: CehA/McbA family metallohydrolase [Vicinamibacteria bacterium]|nr:CehA/McbA family metallohydrolase [Vicinamibacteria bacterium]